MTERNRIAAARDELAATLRAGFRAIIVEADDFRPLADWVLADRARVIEQSRDAMERARAMIGDMLMAYAHGASAPCVEEHYARKVDGLLRDALAAPTTEEAGA